MAGCEPLEAQIVNCRSDNARVYVTGLPNRLASTRISRVDASYGDASLGPNQRNYTTASLWAEWAKIDVVRLIEHIDGLAKS